MMKALLRLTLTLAVIGLWSAHAHALIANDPQFYCDQTGGEWDDCGSGCGPLACDNPSHDPDMMCPAVCTPMCACPEDLPLWREMVGCIAQSDCFGDGDPAPPGMTECEDTGGTWDWCALPCYLVCGDDPDAPIPCMPGCVEQCACPVDAPFWDPVEGCMTQADCDGASPQKTLCGETGGAWNECGSGCGPMGCGDDPAEFETCDDVCLEQCECPDGAPLWHETLGCIAEATCAETGPDADQDGYPEGADCDDTNAGIYPNAMEVCNGVDDNCDGAVDEGCAAQDNKNLCATTGGAWVMGVAGCGPYTCDHLPDPDEICGVVATEGCQCPDEAPLWDPTVGCIAQADCPDAGSGEAPDAGDGDSGGCAGGSTSTSALWLALLALVWTTRRRLEFTL